MSPRRARAREWPRPSAARGASLRLAGHHSAAARQPSSVPRTAAGADICPHFTDGRPRPGGCVFESAVEYHDADILSDLKSTVARLGYDHHYEWYDANQAAYAKRKVLIAYRTFPSS